MSSLTEIFGEPIHCYTRRQAIEDGVLVQLSGPGYVGDAWLPAMVAEAGFRVPLAMTATAFAEYVWPVEDPQREKWLAERCQDMQGRMWDVLWMLRRAIRGYRGPTPATEVIFEFRCVTKSIRPSRCRLKAVCGPDDDGEPCITIMRPEED